MSDPGVNVSMRQTNKLPNIANTRNRNKNSVIRAAKTHKDEEKESDGNSSVAVKDAEIVPLTPL